MGSDESTVEVADSRRTSTGGSEDEGTEDDVAEGTDGSDSVPDPHPPNANTARHTRRMSLLNTETPFVEPDARVCMRPRRGMGVTWHQRYLLRVLTRPSGWYAPGRRFSSYAESTMIRLLAIGTAASMLLASCGSADGEGHTRIVVAAASSLTDAFNEMAKAFEHHHPDLAVVMNFGGSATLREQIVAGGPIDVFAPASPRVMADVAETDQVSGQTRAFAGNRMIIAVSTTGNHAVSGLDDLARSELLVGLCAGTVPCGYFTEQVLAKAGVIPEPDTEAPSVRALLSKLEQGELDVAMVYATDVHAAEGVRGVPISDDYNVTSEYQIAVLANASDPVAAQSFVDFVLSETGRGILDRHGFLLP